MALWLVRAGKHGEREDVALQENVAVIGWHQLPDLSTIKARDDLESLFHKTYPDEKPKTVINWLGQVWAFVHHVQINDLVALPSKKRSAIAFGRVTGAYKYRQDLPEGARHTRPVEWIRTDVPRSAFDQGILYSFGAFMTVCRIQRNNAEERVRLLLQGKELPAPKPPEVVTDEGSVGSIAIDLETYSRDMIRTHIEQNFKERDLERLVQAVLHALNYKTQPAPVGADGGTDIVAGQGPMGFDAPKLCVQVKSSQQPQDVKVLRELQGVMKNFGAEQGLLVSWGGFNKALLSEARRLYFQIRLWDADDLIRQVLDNYEHLPEELQAELPLKRTWILVQEDEQS